MREVCVDGPIRIDGAPVQSLQSRLRIDFGKIYTVEHRVEVRGLGTVSTGSMPLFESFARETLGL